MREIYYFEISNKKILKIKQPYLVSSTISDNHKLNFNFEFSRPIATPLNSLKNQKHGWSLTVKYLKTSFCRKGNHEKKKKKIELL